MKVGVSAVCTIRLFAGAASIVGSSSIFIDEDDVSGCSTIGDLINVLCRLHNRYFTSILDDHDEF